MINIQHPIGNPYFMCIFKLGEENANITYNSRKSLPHYPISRSKSAPRASDWLGGQNPLGKYPSMVQKI